VEDIVRKCLEKDLAKRYNTIAALKLDMKKLGGQPASLMRRFAAALLELPFYFLIGLILSFAGYCLFHFDFIFSHPWISIFFQRHSFLPPNRIVLATKHTQQMATGIAGDGHVRGPCELAEIRAGITRTLRCICF
jgi:hypothetical protein